MTISKHKIWLPRRGYTFLPLGWFWGLFDMSPRETIRKPCFWELSTSYSSCGKDTASPKSGVHELWWLATSKSDQALSNDIWYAYVEQYRHVIYHLEALKLWSIWKLSLSRGSRWCICVYGTDVLVWFHQMQSSDAKVDSLDSSCVFCWCQYSIRESGSR